MLQSCRQLGLTNIKWVQTMNLTATKFTFLELSSRINQPNVPNLWSLPNKLLELIVSVKLKD